MKTISRYIMTLALLLTAVTGAWADEVTVTFTQADLNGTSTVAKDGVTLTPGNDDARSGANFYDSGSNTFSVDKGTFTKIEIVNCTYGDIDGWQKKQGDKYQPNPVDYPNMWEDLYTLTWTGEAESVTFTASVYGIQSIVFTIEPAEPPVTVAWNASTKTGTFAMPGSDVVLTPIYAKAAAFATTGTGSEAKPLLPEAAEGVIAGTDASLIAEGTGIVAFAGTSTEVTQGTLMYAVGNSATEAPALTAFSATAPTAKDVADDGATVYVWYYIKGANAPAGEAATLDNTFDDTEPACLTVTVLTNKFDVTLNAANANTIEAGRATVTVGGTDKTAEVKEGKLTGVKMGSEVKLEANPGYKFRKVEVKKGGAGRPAAEATADDKGKLIGADGNIYDDAAAATAAGTTAVAKIIYLGSETGDATYTHGLALALADEGEMTWATAVGTCSGKNTSAAVPGASWMLPSQVQWNKMISAAGSYTALRDSFSSVGGTNMSSYYYWSSTEIDSDRVYYIYFGNGNWGGGQKGYSDVRTRAVLAF